MTIPGFYRGNATAGSCSRCKAPLAIETEASERAYCAPCLYIVDADLATKRSILLPQAQRDGDALSAWF
jgi:hypothetical protein